ncbi:glycoside hydrolase family 1 protein [Clostridium paraputrificum]|uniref:glycoside hydrolase family 1 protein n=1 Tax=Clostridium TaxID=1485 RepID=UPI00232BD8F3|nr:MULTISPECIES: glycoside hydrolase family 1 protein [Clostridium]MDB2087792.1 glycoside hydrolase family 1 protein [Clostridium paraputrificum]MDB2094707.1 glycoside hydrolase family 1 protein [Clostridium paraputrificum]MDU1178187.1 glycoside hydrolase family 1 protein [Clostridium sp.]MDU1225386.1 glycoside hydrolase family 1 protein [Clostridium sp.]MDU4317758.1 glycoside hydrolase family 1 protein [Clostridium sp.]
MEKKFIFPENFLWGSATSGPQSEGRFNKKHDSVFDYWYDIEPDAFFDKVGPNVASNFYNSYKEDLAMIKEIGLNSFRTSIQWTRLIKDFETAEIDEDGVRFYNDMIDECLKNGLTPIMNLHHFDLPVELYKKYGGWESKHVVDLFVKFAEKAFELFGDRIKYWTTFNEPIVVVEGQYLYKFHYPCLVDGKKAVQVMFNINLASAKAIEAYRKGGYNKDGGKIGIVLNLTPSYPRSESKKDLAAAKFADDFFNNSFLDPAIKGKFPEYLVEKLTEDKVLWEATEEEMAIIKNNTIDFLGVNYYQPRRVKAKEEAYDETLGWMPDKYFDNYIMPGRRMNPYRGWEIYPEAMHDIAMNLKNNYNNIPWYISENGMGVEGEDRYKNEDGIIEDDYRIDFIKEHLEHLHRGIEEGSNCFGYHTWTPIDCWSWLNAYKNRYGYISVDLDTQKKTIKKSGRWIKEVTENNGF